MHTPVRSSVVGLPPARVPARRNGPPCGGAVHQPSARPSARLLLQGDAVLHGGLQASVLLEDPDIPVQDPRARSRVRCVPCPRSGVPSRSRDRDRRTQRRRARRPARPADDAESSGGCSRPLPGRPAGAGSRGRSRAPPRQPPSPRQVWMLQWQPRNSVHCARVKTPPWRQARAIHSARRPVQPKGSSALSRPSR